MGLKGLREMFSPFWEHVPVTILCTLSAMSLIAWFRSHRKSEILDEAKAMFVLAAPALVAQFCRIAVYIVNGLFLVRPFSISTMPLLSIFLSFWSFKPRHVPKRRIVRSPSFSMLFPPILAFAGLQVTTLQ